jgi:hypothetical protein
VWSELAELDAAITAAQARLVFASMVGAGADAAAARAEGAELRTRRARLLRRAGWCRPEPSAPPLIERLLPLAFTVPPQQTVDVLVVTSRLRELPVGSQLRGPTAWAELDELLAPAKPGATVRYRLFVIEELPEETVLWRWWTTAWAPPTGAAPATLAQLCVQARATTSVSLAALQRHFGPEPPEQLLALFATSCALLRILEEG